MTKLISSVFTKRRSLALSLAGSGSAVGETTLVPLSAVVLTLGGWRSAYIVLGAILVIVIIPVSYRLLKSRFVPEVDDRDPEAVARANQKSDRGVACAWMPDDGMSLKQAAKTPIFWALAFGFFT
jgi:MFS family permease